MANETAGDPKKVKVSSAEKQARVAERRRIKNQRVRTRLATAERQLRESVNLGDKTKIATLLSLLYRIADRAAKDNVISKNSAARKKSRLTTVVAKSNGKKK
jgi:small subunit ribosomal protein S20